MPPSSYDPAFWQDLWARTLRDHPDKVATRKPNSVLTALTADLPAGRALDAGCGHGVEALWLAARGWQVTAVDVSSDALEYGSATAVAAGVDAQVQWVQADLATYPFAPSAYDLVVSLYVHVTGDMSDMLARLTTAVRPGGHILLIGHQDTGQQQVSLTQGVDALDPERWTVVVAEEQARQTGGGVDSVLFAQRRTPRL